MAIELATGYVTVTAETSKMAAQIGSVFKGAAPMSARAGREIGKAMTQGFESTKPDYDSLKKDVELAEQKMTAAIERNAEKQRKAKYTVELAEAQLEEKRKNSRTTTSQLLAAEEKLYTAQQKLKASTMTAADEQNKLQKELDQTKTSLSDAYRTANAAADNIESAFDGVKDAIHSAFSGDFKGAFKDMQSSAGIAADKVKNKFSSAGEEAGDGFSKGLTGKLTALGPAIAGLGIGAALSGAMATGVENSKLNDKLAAQLNLTGADAEKAGDIAGNLYAGAWGNDMGEVNDAVSAVMSSIPGMMNAPQAEIEGFTAKAMDLATAFDVDVAQATSTAGILMKNGLAKDGTEAMDLITGAMQNVPASVREEIFPVMDEYSKHFAGLGIDGETAMGLIIKASADGAIGMDKAGDALKEFQIRATDMSKATGEAYDTLGLDMNTMTTELLAGGPRAEEAMGTIVSALQGIKDPAAQSSAALALFGTPLEDMSVDQIPGFLEAINPATAGVVDFTGAAAKMGDTLNDNAATKFESFKRTISTTFIDLMGGRVIPIIEKVAGTAHIWGPFAAGIGAVAAAVGIWAGVQWVAAAAVNATIWPMTLTVAAIGTLVGAVIYAYNNIGWFKDGVTSAFNWIKVVVSGVVTWFATQAMPWIMNAVRSVASGFSWFYNSVVKPVWTGIRIAVAVVVGAIMTLFQGITWVLRNTLGPVFRWFYNSVIVPVWNAIRNTISTIWNGAIKPIFNSIKSFLQNTLGPVFRWFRDSVIKPVWNGIRDSVMAVWRFVKQHAFDPMANIIKSTLPKAFEAGKKAIETIWNGIRSVAAKPVDFVVNTVVKGLTDNIDKVLSKVGLKDKQIKFKGIDIPGFAQGGYTGPGGKYQPAGVVHAGEYVIPKEQTRDLMSRAPGFLQSIHKRGSEALGYATGGLVGALPGFAKGGMVWPVPKNHPITQYPSGGHMAYDIGTPVGTRVGAAQEGRVAHAGPGQRVGGVFGGNEVHLDHGGGTFTWYAHLEKIMVRVGQMVKAGQQIATSGNTGISSGPHLHFQAMRGGEYNLGNSFDPKAEGVLRAGEFASGGAQGFLSDLLSPVTNIVSGMANKIKGRFPGAGAFVDMAGGAAKTVGEGALNWITEKASAVGDYIDNGINWVKGKLGIGDQGQVTKWMTEALKMSGNYSPENLRAGVARAMQESGGDPNITQGIIDVNSGGNEARGLMQVIPPTFKAHAAAGRNNIFDPIDNILASINYTKSRYGSLVAGWTQPGGYSEGGLVTPMLHDDGGFIQPGFTLVNNKTGKPEPVFNPRQWNAIYDNVSGDGNGSGQTIINVERKESENGYELGNKIDNRLKFLAGRTI